MSDEPGINRDFTTISPSAKWILLMKGHTKIPFARQTAELIEYPEKFIPDFNNSDFSFWARTMHFESRYLGIDLLLSDLRIKNILELSAGFSFRGLDLIRRKDVHYIDTDLPVMIEEKKKMMAELETDSEERKGTLELIPLNVLDEKSFNEIVNRFPEGEVVIVNEGLLVYLDASEKEKLCRIIHSVLKKRGGYWITADIYLKLAGRKIDLRFDEKTKKFFEQHKVEENRFENFEEAEKFFQVMGFVIDKEAEVDFSKLSSFPYFIKNATPGTISKMREGGKIHATWRLRLSEDRK